MQAHTRWFLAQRIELDRMRRTGERTKVLFEWSGTFGEDCLNLPPFPRVANCNSGKYTYKIKLQVSILVSIL